MWRCWFRCIYRGIYFLLIFKILKDKIYHIDAFLCLVFKDEHEFKNLSGQNIQIKLAQTILKFNLCCSLSDNFLFWSDFICTIVYLPAYGNFYILILIKLRLFLNNACIKRKLAQRYIIFLSVVSYFSYILFSIKKTFIYF